MRKTGVNVGRNDTGSGRHRGRVAAADGVARLLKKVIEAELTPLVHRDREEARRNVFDYIEMFYNPKRRHGYSNRRSPIDYEKQYAERLTSV
jgi:putative transposase